MDKLNKLLQYAVTNIPAYGQYKNKKLDIEVFPVVTKAEIKSNYSEYLSDEYLNDKERIVNVLEGKFEKLNSSYNEVYEFDNYIFEETTGTSGVPFRVVKTKSERIRASLSIWKHRKYYDDSVDTQNLFCLNHLGLHDQDKGTYNFTEENIVKLYKEIEESNARWLHVSPNPLYEHIKILQKGKVSYNFSKIKYIECTGNYYNNQQEKLFHDYFGAEIVNQYGSIETWGIAMSCKNKDLHVLQDNVYLELLDENNQIIDDYDKIGYVTVTTLNQRLMPLIRYQNGDLAMWKKNLCSCGICSPVLELAPGRKVHLIRGIDDRIFGNIFFMKVIQRAVRECKEMDTLTYVQVIQTAENEFTVYANKLNNNDQFVESIKNLTEQLLKKTYQFKTVILTDDLLLTKRSEKVNLFLCK